MANKKIKAKVIFNKRTGQPMIFPSKKQMKKLNPTIKFDKNLFVSLEVFSKKK